MILDSGEILFDSPVICEYLDSLHEGRRVFPQDETRWRALRWQAMADGVLDAAVLVVAENGRRPQDLRWQEWVDFQLLAVSRSLDQFAAEMDMVGEQVDIGTLSLACALGYLDFRLPDFSWRDQRPGLASWYAAFATRASIDQTVPREAT